MVNKNAICFSVGAVEYPNCIFLNSSLYQGCQTRYGFIREVQTNPFRSNVSGRFCRSVNFVAKQPEQSSSKVNSVSLKATSFNREKRKFLNKSWISYASTQMQSNVTVANLATAKLKPIRADSVQVGNGEISKEPLMDLLLTDLEQTTFSLSKVNSLPLSFLKKVKLFSETYTNSTKNAFNLAQNTIEEVPFDDPALTNFEAGQSPVSGKEATSLNISTASVSSHLNVSTQIGKYIKCNDKIGDKDGIPVVLGVTGKVIKISKSQITIQKTQPVLFFTKGQVHVQNGQWVDRGMPILTLSHQTLITGDIVQGIPKIEQLFEAPTSKEGQLNFESLQSQVKEIFVNNLRKLPFPTAGRKSIELIQQVLVESIQKVYLSQGVLIADKHIEIVVRQMTSKARVLDSGDTGLFLNEVLPVPQIENANITTPGKKAFYIPTVIGLTRAALNSDSFISAASFQETTRVLSRDALMGKSDFLRGLKEKVVIGDLISAGTGLDVYTIYNRFVHKEALKKYEAPRYTLDIAKDEIVSESFLLAFQKRKEKVQKYVPRKSLKPWLNQAKRLVRVN